MKFTQENKCLPKANTVLIYDILESLFKFIFNQSFFLPNTNFEVAKHLHKPKY